MSLLVPGIKWAVSSYVSVVNLSLIFVKINEQYIYIYTDRVLNQEACLYVKFWLLFVYFRSGNVTLGGGRLQLPHVLRC